MATEQFANTILPVIQLLHKHKIQFLVIGGTALAFYGFVRPTTIDDGSIADEDDLDFWYNPRYHNYIKLLNALQEMGADVSKYRKEEHPNVKKDFFHLKPGNFTVDFLPVEKSGLSFEDCYKRRNISLIEEVEVSVISAEDLLISKQSSGRKKDLNDIEFLRKLLSEL